MTKIDQTIRDWVAAHFCRQRAFLSELVRCPSDNPPGDCAPHAEIAGRLLEELGFVVERHAPPQELVRAHGMTSAINLVVRHRFGAGPTLALNAHGDVVAPGAGWTHDPYGAEIVDGTMYGRGVAVSKSDFATYAFALLALRAVGPGRGTVELHLTYDEEQGGEIGPGWLLSEGIVKPDYAICAGFSYGVVVAHNGCLHLEVETQGRSAHAAVPATGVDALEAATGILTALYRFRAALADRRSNIPGVGSAQLNVGLIAGGVNTNVVPDRVTLRLDRRVLPEENPETVELELRALIAAAAEAYPKASVLVRRVLLARPLAPVPEALRLADILSRWASATFGESITSIGAPLYTDARHYAEHGVPVALYGAGPRTIEEANGHRADERLRLDDLRKATEVITCAALDALA
jgi:succinyl-diaminopimelate desuccinylase